MLLGIVVVNFVDFVWILVGDVGVFIVMFLFLVLVKFFWMVRFNIF